MNWNRLLEPGVLALIIPILAIVGWIVVTLIKHRERMAMIANGIHPDAVKDSEEKAGTSLPGSSS